MLDRGVEVIHGISDDWLGSRLFHYDAVISDDEGGAFSAALIRTQPQAPLISLLRLDGSPVGMRARLVSALIHAGISSGEPAGC
jgi:hypothetical protein